MTLAEVAARLGIVSTGVIYYFKNKEQLAEAAFLAAVDKYCEFLAAAAEPTTPRARLQRLFEAYFEFRRRVRSGEDGQIAIFNDVRALNSASVNEAYTRMFRAARKLFDTEPPAWSRTHRNARAHLLLSELFWSVVWLEDVAVDDFQRAATRMTSILGDGLAYSRAWSAPPLLDLQGPGEVTSSAAEPFLRAATKLINAEGYWSAPLEVIHPLSWSADRFGWNERWPGSGISRKRSSPSCGKLMC